MILAAFLVKRLKHYPRLFLLAIMSVCAAMSMFISNVAAPLLCTSIVVPIIHDLPDKSNYIRHVMQ
jgi:phosphate transporter